MASNKKALKEYSMNGVRPRDIPSSEEAGLIATKTPQVEIIPETIPNTIPDTELSSDVEEKSAASPINWIPWGVTSFQEIEQFENAREIAFEIAEKSNLFPQLIENIMGDDSIENKSEAVGRVSTEFAAFVKAKTDAVDDIDKSSPSWLQQVDNKIDSAITKFASKFSKLSTKNDNINNNGLVIWKQDDQYKFLAIYSNNYRDVETEIISAKSHERFVDMVDSGEFPMPTLQHFHVKGTDWGQAEMVHYDEETGFMIASGYILPGHEHEAKALMEMEDIAMSHGMLKSSVKRDPSDNNIIIEHQTIEISDLPLEAAANKLTNFHIIKEANNMALSEEKKAYLEKVGLKDIGGLEKSLRDGKTLAVSLQLDSKEEGDPVAPAAPVEVPVTPAPVAPVEPVVEAAPAVEVVAPAETPVETPAPETLVAPASEIPAPAAEAPAVEAPAFTESQTKELADALGALAVRIIEATEKSLDAKLAPIIEKSELTVQQNDVFHKDILNETPMAALQDMILSKDFLQNQSSNASPNTLVDGRSSLAKSGPVETEIENAMSVLNSGNKLADNLAEAMVSGEFLEELKNPKKPA